MWVINYAVLVGGGPIRRCAIGGGCWYHVSFRGNLWLGGGCHKGMVWQRQDEIVSCTRLGLACEV